MGQSLFYSFNPPLADNYIIAHPEIEPFIKDVAPHSMTYMVQNAISLSGSLVFFSSPLAIQTYLSKVYGEDMHPIAKDLMKLERFVYGVSAQDVYQRLQKRYMKELTENNEGYGGIASIDPINRLIRLLDGGVLEYENIISTVPLDVLNKWCEYDLSFKSNDVYYRHIATKSLDFEESYIVHVADEEIPFYKVSRYSPVDFVFESFSWLNDAVLHAFVDDFQSVNHTSISNAFPLGPPPNLDYLEKDGIYCVGSLAQHDDLMCVSSCLNRLTKIVSNKHETRKSP